MKILAMVAIAVTLAACADPGEQGKQIRIDDLRGKWVVINYWAQWCKPCIQEIPELNELDRSYEQLVVVGVNYDGATGDELADQVGKLNIEFAILPHDPAGSLGTSRPMVLPTTLILNPDGELTQTLLGPQTLASLAQATEQAPPNH
ncbi:MAG: TlpA disulfide reductase family protein [Halioglobus sp.]